MKKILAFLVIAVILSMGTAFAGSDNLCYKGPTTGWSCGANPDPAYSSATGSVEYDDVSSQLVITVDLQGLKPDFDYQLTLNGRCGGDGNTEIANNCPKPNTPASWYDYSVDWECGTWPKNCDGTPCREGFWNFDMDATTDSNGDYKKTYYLNLPIGHYGPTGKGCDPMPCCDWKIGFIVKEAVSPWSPVLMDEEGLEWWIVGRDEERQEIWDKLTLIQDEFLSLKDQVEEYIKPKLKEIQIEIDNIWDKLTNIQNEISDLRTYIDNKLTEIWSKLHHLQDVMPECFGDETKCENNDRYTCMDHKWQFDQLCEYGCSEGECNPPTEDCNLKDNKYCWYSWYSIKEDYYCEEGFGSDEKCEEGHCLMKKTREYCRYRCKDGKCNPPPTTTTIPECTIPDGSSWRCECDSDRDCPEGYYCKQQRGPDPCVLV